MATNRELRYQAVALADELGLPPPATDGLGSPALTSLVSDLRAQKRARDAEAGFKADAEAEAKAKAAKSAGPPVQGDEKRAAKGGPPDPPPADEAPPAKARAPGFYVAAGVSITSPRGNLGPGTRVRTKSPRDYDPDLLQSLVQRRLVVEVKSSPEA